MSGCKSARAIRSIQAQQRMAAQGGVKGAAAQLKLKQWATAFDIAGPYLTRLQQFASDLSQITLRGGTVLVNDAKYGRHVEACPPPPPNPPTPAAAAGAAGAAQSSSPTPSTASPAPAAAAPTAAAPGVPPVFRWGRDGLVLIIALELTRVLVIPDSHHEVLLVEAVRMGTISEDEFQEKMAQLRKMKVYRVTLEPGQVLGMRGYTIHAGDSGLKGKASTRVHFYGTVPNVTFSSTSFGQLVRPVDEQWQDDWALGDGEIEGILLNLLSHEEEADAAEKAEQEAQKQAKPKRKRQG
ncbi:hypothetical protein V8C86DRAFT_2437341 [Haematococcus lacustris]